MLDPRNGKPEDVVSIQGVVLGPVEDAALTAPTRRRG